MIWPQTAPSTVLIKQQIAQLEKLVLAGGNKAWNGLDERIHDLERAIALPDRHVFRVKD